MSKLIPEHILNQIPTLYSTENEPDPTVYIKLFTPDSAWSWYITEYDPEERLCFGLVKGFETELGYFSLEELEALRGPARMPLQIDKSFKPTRLEKIREEIS